MQSFPPFFSSLMAGLLAVSVVLVPPAVRAEEATAGSESTSQGSGQGAGQGGGQGTGQGDDQGGPTAADLGIGSPDVDQSAIVDTRVGSGQGSAQGAGQGTTEARAVNEQTGADSTNTSTVDSSQEETTTVTQASNVSTTADGLANTGGNAASENTGSASLSTGTASVGLEQLTVDNFVTTGSSTEVEHNVSGGSQEEDLVLSFDPGASGDDQSESFRSINRVTGSDSENTATIEQSKEKIVEVQNDGVIENTLGLSAVSGQNEAIQNTGAAAIVTGDANVAATLLNFLNTTVVDGALWLSVTDIFGDLGGNIVIPEEAVAYLERRQRELLVEASNESTGSDSTNTVEVDLTRTDTTALTNEAEIENTVIVNAVTGQNVATQNTGAAAVTTGDVHVTTNTVTLANVNVVDGNLGLIIVNALNRWLGFLVGSDGRWTPVDHEYSTLVEAGNSATGEGSTNTAAVDVTEETTTDVTNAATVSNELTIEAITGQNSALQNTGNASVNTGDARVNATVVNVVNTNVVRGGLFAVVVNVFGNWFGDLFFGGAPLEALSQAPAAHGVAGGGVAVNAENRETGSSSENTIDVAVEDAAVLEVENTADIINTLIVSADTGSNEANRNTGLGTIDTGDALAVLHARNIANVTVADIGSPWANLTADLLNATTGAESTNTIDVTFSDDREVSVLNEGTVDTLVGAFANTGFNTASRNTLGGRVETGVAAIDAAVENLLNQSWLLSGGQGTPQLSLRLLNEETGADSTNANFIDPTVSSEVDVVNEGTAVTFVLAFATTGGNEASDNTGGGAVGSGAADVQGALKNAVNETKRVGSGGGPLDLSVESTADVLDTVIGFASTGGNDASRNTGTLPGLSREVVPAGLPPPSVGGSSPVLLPPPAGSGGSGAGGGGGTASGVSGSGGEEEQASPRPAVRKKMARPRVKESMKIATLTPLPASTQKKLWRKLGLHPVVRRTLGVRVVHAAAAVPENPDTSVAESRWWHAWPRLSLSVVVSAGSSSLRALVHLLTGR